MKYAKRGCLPFTISLNKWTIVHYKGQRIIINEALASLTLLVATCKAEEMDAIKQLLMIVLGRDRSRCL